MRDIARKPNALAKQNSPSLARPLSVAEKEARHGNDHSPASAPAFGRDFSQIPVRGHPPIRIQSKLTVGAAGDAFEQEADRIAEQVMRMPEPRGRSQDRASSPERSTTPAARVQTKSMHAGDSGGIEAPPIVHEVLDSPGQPLDAASRAFFEPRFGQDFSRVRVHTDARAAESSRAMDALAYTRGRDICFGPQQFRPGTDAGARLIAHELAHTIQQRGGVRSQPFRVGDPGDAAEVRADTAADAVMSGRPVPDVGTAGDVLQRAVTTNGGSFDTTLYSPVDAPTGAVGDRLGANILLEFRANDLVESTKIGLIQSTKAMRSSVAGGLRDTVATGVGDPEEGQLIMGAGQVDPGREIDVAIHPGGRAAPSTSPIYGVGYTTGGGEVTLSAGIPTVGTSQWGSHTKDPLTHLFTPAVPARIEDGPGRIIGFAGQTFEHTFEVAALAVQGPIPVNTYLGSVSWGWRSDAAGKVTIAPLAVAHVGAPSAAFMGAAARWNAATLHTTGTAATAPSIDLPITTMESGTVAAVNRSTVSLLAHIALVDWDIAGLPAGTDRTNKEFEKRALEAELPRRNVKVSVHVISTEDWTGADEVYVKLTGPGGGVAVSRVRSLNDGDSDDFLLPLATLLPLTGPINVQIYDQDSPDADDRIVDMNFAAPWAAAHNARSMDDANYDVTVTFER